MRRIFIYALVDPRDRSVRYIGRTVNLKVRQRGHVPHRGENKVKRAWLADLWAAGLRARAVVLRWTTDPVVAARLENEMTEKARAEGQPLTNGSGSRGRCGATAVHDAKRSRFRTSYVSVRNLKTG